VELTAPNARVGEDGFIPLVADVNPVAIEVHTPELSVPEELTTRFAPLSCIVTVIAATA
jgi:hypothetical protein